MKRLHIVGAPRSGTTLMLELILACYRVSGDHRECSVFRPAPADSFGAYCTKKPRETMAVGPLLRMDPSLWVVHLTRDPRDVIASEHGDAPGSYYLDLDFWLADYDAAKELHSEQRFIALAYEELVRAPDELQDNLEARIPWLPELRTHRFSAFPEEARPSPQSLAAMHGLRPISSASIGTWRTHGPRVAAQFRRYPRAAEAVVGLGYEPDLSWVDKLPKEEYLAKSASNPFHLMRRLRRRLHNRFKTGLYWLRLRRQ